MEMERDERPVGQAIPVSAVDPTVAFVLRTFAAGEKEGISLEVMVQRFAQLAPELARSTVEAAIGQLKEAGNTDIDKLTWRQALDARAEAVKNFEKYFVSSVLTATELWRSDKQYLPM